MEILGIGIPELLFIVLLILILFGPKEMVKTGRTLGRWLNQMVNSPTYKLLTRTGNELKNLPRNLMRESNFEETKKEFEALGQSIEDTNKRIGRPFFDEKNVFGQSTTPDDAKKAGQDAGSAEEETAQNDPSTRPPKLPQDEA